MLFISVIGRTWKRMFRFVCSQYTVNPAAATAALIILCLQMRVASERINRIGSYTAGVHGFQVIYFRKIVFNPSPRQLTDKLHPLCAIFN